MSDTGGKGGVGMLSEVALSGGGRKGLTGGATVSEGSGKMSSRIAKRREGQSADKKFGAVTVYAPQLALSSATAAIKTYIVTCHTTANQLRDMVMEAYDVIIIDRTMFYMVLETCSGFGQAPITEELTPTDLPLVKMSSHAALDARFVLKSKRSVGVLNVINKTTCNEARLGSSSYHVIISHVHTARDVIAAALDLPISKQSTATACDPCEEYVLCEADDNNQVVHLLAPTHQPLHYQHQQHEHGDDVSTRRGADSHRKHDSCTPLYPPTLQLYLVTDIVKTQYVGRGEQIGLDTDILYNDTILSIGSDGDIPSTMSQLKDSLTKLKEHLATLQHKKTQPEDTKSAPSANIHTPNSDHSHHSGLRVSSSGGAGGSGSGGEEQRSGHIHTNELQAAGGGRGDDSNNMEQYYQGLADDDAHSPREGTYVGGDAGHEARSGGNGGGGYYHESDSSRHGTNDSAYASDRVSHHANDHALRHIPHYPNDHVPHHTSDRASHHQHRRQRRGSGSSEESSNEGRNSKSSRVHLKKSQSLLELKPVGYSTARSYVQPQLTAQRVRMRGSTNDLHNIAQDDHLTTWARRKQYDTNMRKVRTAEVVRRSQSFQTNQRCPPENNTERPGSFRKSSTRRSLPQVPGKQQRIPSHGAAQHPTKLRHQQGLDNSDSSDNEIERELVTPHSRRALNGGEDPWSAEKLLQYKPKRRASIGSHAQAKQRGMRHQLPYKESTSHEALQQIITDLRDAAEKPYEGNQAGSRVGSRVASRTASRPVSSTSFSSIANDSHHGHHHHRTGKGDGDLSYDQLAAMGIIPPSNEEVVMIKPTPSHATKAMHPTLYNVVSCCDLVSVVLESVNDQGLGLHLFESSFNDGSFVPKKERHQVYRSPSGRKPLIGHKSGSAFVAVNRTARDSDSRMSLVAVDQMPQNGVAALSGLIKEGDYIVEVNSESCLNMTVAAVQSKISEAIGSVHLVLGRPKATSAVGEKGDGGPLQELTKDFEKLQLKYTGLKEDHEKSVDQIAELQLELRYSNKQLQQTQDQLLRQQQRLQDYDNELFSKEEAVNEWKYEANQRNMELARLKYESKQKDDRIAQLRSLLIQHTEMMEHNGMMWGAGEEGEDLDEHVSAV